MSQAEFEISPVTSRERGSRSCHDAGLIGESTGRTRDDGDGLMVQVPLPGPAAALRDGRGPGAGRHRARRPRTGAGRQVRQCRTPARKRLTSVQLAGQLSEMIYSRTRPIPSSPRQFKAVACAVGLPFRAC